MSLIITDSSKDPFDKYTGLANNSNGGTELLHRELLKQLSPELKDKFQIICSRFRELEPDKIPIFWLHDLFTDPEVQRLAEPNFRAQFKKLIFVSDWQFQTYNLGLGVPYSDSIVIKNSIHPIDVDIDSKPTDKINLIYHTTPHRGLEILIPAFESLCKIYDNLNLDVFSSFKAYGWEHRDAPYQHIFDFCEKHPNITYHGWQPNDVVREKLKNAHIFAYPSIWKETSCLAAIEAVSAGALVVCPNLGALKETVGDMGVVYHWNENLNIHTQNFANILNSVIQNFQSFSDLRRNAKLRIDTLYSWQNNLPQWNYTLNQILLDNTK